MNAPPGSEEFLTFIEQQTEGKEGDQLDMLALSLLYIEHDSYKAAMLMAGLWVEAIRDFKAKERQEDGR